MAVEDWVDTIFFLVISFIMVLILFILRYYEFKNEKARWQAQREGRHSVILCGMFNASRFLLFGEPSFHVDNVTYKKMFDDNDGAGFTFFLVVMLLLAWLFYILYRRRRLLRSEEIAFLVVHTLNMAALAVGVAAGALYVGCYLCCKGAANCKEQYPAHQQEDIFNISSRVQEQAQWPTGDAYLTIEQINLQQQMNKPAYDAPPSYEEAIRIAAQNSSTGSSAQVIVTAPKSSN